MKELIYIRKPGEFNVDEDDFYSMKWEFADFYPAALMVFAGSYIECEIEREAAGAYEMTLYIPKPNGSVETITSVLRREWIVREEIAAASDPERMSINSERVTELITGAVLNVIQNHEENESDTENIEHEIEHVGMYSDYISFGHSPINIRVMPYLHNTLSDLSDNVRERAWIIEQLTSGLIRLINDSDSDEICVTIREFLKLEIPYGTRMWINGNIHIIITGNNMIPAPEGIVYYNNEDGEDLRNGLFYPMMYLSPVPILRYRINAYVPGAYILSTLFFHQLLNPGSLYDVFDIDCITLQFN